MEEEARLKVEESLKEEERIKKEKEIEDQMKGGKSSKGTIKGMFAKIAKRKAEEASSGNTKKTKMEKERCKIWWNSGFDGGENVLIEFST